MTPPPVFPPWPRYGSTTTTIFVKTTDRTRITTTSTSTHCETITGCSVKGSDHSITTLDQEIGTQTIAPIDVFPFEACFTDIRAVYSSSVFASLSAAPAAQGFDEQEGGLTIGFTPGAAAAPTCASGTGCGRRLCLGYWCSPSPTGVTLGFSRS